MKTPTPPLLSTHEPSHPSQYAFDIAALGDPSAEFVEHVASCEACRQELAERRSAQAAFVTSDRPRTAAHAIAERSSRPAVPSRPARWFAPAALSTITAVAAAFAIAFRLASPSEIRTKGGPSIDVYVRRADLPARSWRTMQGPLQSHDRVQLAYRNGRASRVSVFSVEIGCTVRREYSGNASDQGVVPASWEITGASGTERLYAVFGDREVSEREFRRALEREQDGCGARAVTFERDGLSVIGVALRGNVAP